MIEVLDFYAQGLDRRKDVVELHKKAKEELRIWTTRANNAKPGTPAATDAPRKRDLWAKAKHVFSTEEGRKKYDAELTAWQSSVDAQRAKGQADQLAKDFASATETVLELVARAWEELDKGNLRAASQVASKAMRLDASQWEAYLIAGIASFRQNDFDESMFCMRHAARLNPDNAQVFSGLGELYERLDNWQEAFKHYSKAIALAPDDVDYKIRAGFVCVKAEVPDQGIELLRRALEIDPDHQGAKWALGVALAESAQLGWTEVPEGHPRVPPGWYAMSRNQALQAIRKLHEANALGVEDQELSTHLAKVKQDVDRNIKRHFDGSWVLFGVILLVAFFLKSNIGVSLMVAVLAAVYYGAYLPPQYTINARILAGDSKLKTGFMNWLENIQNPWIKLIINLILIELIPIFTLYSAIKNWTGENAPLGKDLKDIGSTSESTVPSFANITIEANASVIKKTDSVLANFSPQSIFTSSKLRSLAISIINSLPLLRLKSLANSIEKSFSSLKLKSLAISIPKSFPSFKLKSLAISIPKSFPSLRLKSLVIFMVVASLTVLFGYYLIAMSNNLHRPESMITANKKLLNLLQNEPEKINFQIIDDLLSSGANPNLNDTYNAQTVLAWAIGNNKVDIARLLIKNGADVNSVSSSDPSRPAIVGVRSVEMLELLLKNGANINAVGSDGRSILHLSSNPMVVEFALSNGVKVNAIDEFGRTPLDELRREQSILSEAKINGKTSNIYRFEERDKANFELIQLLLNSGATGFSRDTEVNASKSVANATTQSQLDSITSSNSVVKPKVREKRPSMNKSGTQVTRTTVPHLGQTTANPQPNPAPENPTPTVRSRTIDEAYNQRINVECPQGFFPGLVCREKVRWQLCDGKWSQDIVSGQSICIGAPSAERGN